MPERGDGGFGMVIAKQPAAWQAPFGVAGVMLTTFGVFIGLEFGLEDGLCSMPCAPPVWPDPRVALVFVVMGAGFLGVGALPHVRYLTHAPEQLARSIACLVLAGGILELFASLFVGPLMGGTYLSRFYYEALGDSRAVAYAPLLALTGGFLLCEGSRTWLRAIAETS
jgi:hypothetical protein